MNWKLISFAVVTYIHLFNLFETGNLFWSYYN